MYDFLYLICINIFRGKVLNEENKGKSEVNSTQYRFILCLIYHFAFTHVIGI